MNANRLVALCIVALFSVGCEGRVRGVSIIRFTLNNSQPLNSFSYIPVKKDGDSVQLATAYHKTFDAPGYHEADVTFEYPENLATPWRLKGHADTQGLGIVVFERPPKYTPPSSTRVFWFPPKPIPDGGQVVIKVPRYETLPEFSSKIEGL